METLIADWFEEKNTWCFPYIWTRRSCFVCCARPVPRRTLPVKHRLEVDMIIQLRIALQFASHSHLHFLINKNALLVSMFIVSIRVSASSLSVGISSFDM